MSRTDPRHDLLFARDFPPMGGGIARWMSAIANEYPPGELTVSTGSSAGAPAADRLLHQRVDRIGVDVERLRTLPGLLSWARRAVQLARDPAIRFAWCDTIRPSAYVAHWAFRRTGVPYGIMVVGNDVLTLRAKLGRSAFKRRIIRNVLGDAAAFVAISHWTAAQLRQLLLDLHLDRAAARIRIVPLGTDPVQLRADPAAGDAFRAKHQLPAGRWLLTVARLVDYKGIDSAIAGVATLAGSEPDLHYAVIGRGPDEPATARTLRRALVSRERVHILTGVSDGELAAAYSMCDIYIGLTRETPLDVEGFGISFAEAAACGVPVIAARSGGIADAVVDGETGILVSPDDSAATAKAVAGLLGDPAGRRRMGAAGRERVERYLNWERVVGEMREVARESGIR